MNASSSTKDEDNPSMKNMIFQKMVRYLKSSNSKMVFNEHIIDEQKGAVEIV